MSAEVKDKLENETELTEEITDTAEIPEEEKAPTTLQDKYILPKDIRDIIEKGTYNAELTEEKPLQIKTSERRNKTKVKIEKNYLTSKEAFELILSNYDSISFKPEIINYSVEFLTECYINGEKLYVDKVLFLDDFVSKRVQNDLVTKILHNKNYLLFGYYFKKMFVDLEPRELNYIDKIIRIQKINSNLKPKDLREYYANNLQIMLSTMAPTQIEGYYKEAQKEFEVLPNTYYTIDLYSNFIVPALQNKIKEMEINSFYDLKKACIFINKHPDLKYNRYSRILLTSFELLNTKGDYLSYDQDIVYDVQEVISNILLNDKILDYNLIHFCSYFDGRVDFRKSLNLIINILEGTNTIALSKTKYQQIKEKTIFESLSYMQWLLENHPKKTKSSAFDDAIEDFLYYNWSLFTSSNKTYISMKTMLGSYPKLDEVIAKVKKSKASTFKSWYNKNGPFVFSSIITLAIFAVGCFYGVQFVSGVLDKITNQLTIVTLILIEVIVIALLIVMMMLEKDEK